MLASHVGYPSTDSFNIIFTAVVVCLVPWVILVQL